MKRSELVAALKDFPYKDLRFAKVDTHRGLRRDFAEVIYAKGKTPADIVAIARVLRESGHSVLVTKLDSAKSKSVRKELPWLTYFPEARIAASGFPPRRIGNGRKPEMAGSVLIVTAGTSDIPVAEECFVTLRSFGIPARKIFDVGVAGLHRVLAHRKQLQAARVIVVVAGMDGALPSVISGLVGSPVIAVPTSAGYGASFKGVAPLLTMLNSCSPGVAVVNIDNGFGAGYLAAAIVRNK